MTLSRRSPPRSYSAACSRNAAVSISRRSLPPASFMCARSADAARVEGRRELDVELRKLGDVEGRRRLGEEPVHPRMLAVVDPDRPAQVLQAPGALVPQARDRLEHLVEPTQFTQRGQGT